MTHPLLKHFSKWLISPANLTTPCICCLNRTHSHNVIECFHHLPFQKNSTIYQTKRDYSSVMAKGPFNLLYQKGLFTCHTKRVYSPVILKQPIHLSYKKGLSTVVPKGPIHCRTKRDYLPVILKGPIHRSYEKGLSIQRINLLIISKGP